MRTTGLLLVSAAVVVAQETFTLGDPTASELPTATRTTAPTSTGGGSADEPCAIASSLASDAAGIPAATAFACLDSVPVDVDGDSKLIDELKLAWEWQSDIAWLKKTPPEWELGSIDIFGELDKIKDGLSSNFSSEYAVQSAIQDLVLKTGNFHWNYRPDILQVFQFYRGGDIVSLSSDGNSLPKLYDSFDALVLSQGGDSSDVSEITQINGEDAYEYVQKVAALEQYIDGDGQLNSMVFKGDTESPGSWMYSTRYDGATTKYTFANGSEVEIDNLAYTNEFFDGVTDGASFFETFCTGSISGFVRGREDRINPGHLGPKPHIPHRYVPVVDKRQAIPSTYPRAVAIAEDGSVGGYFLDGEGYEDVAVLKVITFAPESDFTGNEFQAVIKDFLDQSIQENKQKLIVDLRENGGGAPHLVLDMFMQLFPEQEPFCAQRYRSQEQFTKIGEAVEEIHNSGNLSRFETEYFDNNFRYWAYWHFITAQGENFKDWAEFAGPHTFNDDSFTTLMRYNTSGDTVSVGPEGFAFSNGTRQTAFNASNVVMFTDGMCGSACATIHEELKNIAGVKSVVVGGRPQEKPAQAVSGTKGGEVLPLYFFPEYATMILNQTESTDLFSTLENSKVNDLAQVSQALIRTGDGRTRIQTQDALRKGDTTGTPLQYIYEAADCRIFYTSQTFADPENAWKQAWDAFSDDSKCVQGSTGDSSSISGGYQPFGAGEVSDDQEPTGTNNPPSTTSGGANPTGTGKKNAAGKVAGPGAAAALLVAGLVMMLQ